MIHTCALQADLDILPGADLTEIGEKVSLRLSVSTYHKKRIFGVLNNFLLKGQLWFLCFGGQIWKPSTCTITIAHNKNSMRTIKQKYQAI